MEIEMENNRFVVQAFKAGGVANILGGILVAAAYLMHPQLETPEVIGSNYWLWTHVIFVFSLLLGILGLVALMGYTLRRGGLKGLVGYLIAISSLILIFGLNYFETFINPVLAAETPHFVVRYGAGVSIGMVGVLFPVTGALFVAGYLTFSVVLIRIGDLGRAAPVMMIVGVVVFGAGLSGFFPMAVVKTGSVLFGLGTVYLGYQLFRLA